ncbi:potassium channel K1, putative [Plasmodium yoelii]|uniref:Potassium channel K1 n=2 Tax=Plasmodium yoelii TaxID=5861 RepID=A0AAE9X2W6_PLAYO|nr:potassium channel K1, putative [Plasmodium yoelii]WBY61054.1 potassium channel K1 [Plasmodium yoelii yoelii]CDU20790.1 potassium channel, putative [Plasmodium yoelii]VTZ81753.1 potassium channel K1, putative [Plasmodium yoelii]|eukprot:XP_022812978.1 potassium channel K1, putative [Plasmodium yoelii]
MFENKTKKRSVQNKHKYIDGDKLSKDKDKLDENGSNTEKYNKIDEASKKEIIISSRNSELIDNKKIKEINENGYNKSKINSHDEFNITKKKMKNNNDNIIYNSPNSKIKVVSNNNFKDRKKGIHHKKRRSIYINQITLFKIHNYIYKTFVFLLCLFIVILVLYASIDISQNYGPIIILYIIMLEFGSMLISYILLQFPFFYLILKNMFTRTSNINKYSHQYSPLYYENPSDSDDKDSIDVKRRETKKRRKTFGLFNLYNIDNNKYSIKKKILSTKLKIYNKEESDKNEHGNLNHALNTNLSNAKSRSADEAENYIIEDPNMNHNDQNVDNNSKKDNQSIKIRNHKRENIYLDDCNMWIRNSIKKSRTKGNFNLTRSLSFNIKLSESNKVILNDSRNIDNLRIYLNHRSSKYEKKKNQINSLKLFAHNKYAPLTFSTPYKYSVPSDIFKTNTEGSKNLSAEISESSDDVNGLLHKNNNKSYSEEKDSSYKRKKDKEFYTDKSAILFSNKHTKQYVRKKTFMYDDLDNLNIYINKKHNQKNKKKKSIFCKIKGFNKIKNILYFFVNYNIKSSKTQNNVLLFFRGLTLYIKHQFIQHLSYEPVWIIAILIRIILWCIVWLWAAGYMTRPPKNYKINAWNMKSIPPLYGYIECTFQWCGVLDYLFGLYFSNNKLKYIFSFFSLIDFITTPVSSFIMNFVWKNDYHQTYWFLILGPLRFLRLVRAESTMSSCFFWLSDVKIIIIGIIILSLAILFTFSGIMYILEAPDIERQFISPLDFVYFGVITMSTVGYGDYTPVTPAGKCLTMFIIVTCFTFVGAQLKRLKEAMFSPKTIMGIIPKPDDDYILILGPVSPTQLLYICKGINNSFPNSVESIFLFTPLPVIIYRYVYGSIIKNTNIKICINGGNECFICPSIIYDAVINARALYILNNVDSEKYTLLNQQIFLASNNFNFNNNDKNQRIRPEDILHNNIINKFTGDKKKTWKFTDIYSEHKNQINKNNMLNLEMNINVNDSHMIREKDDQECILRFIGTYNISNALIPITVQLSNNTYEELIKSMNVYNYISIEELKYALLAKSINCKGLFFLIINFFYKPKAVKSLKKYIIDLRLLMYNNILKKKNHKKINSTNIKIKNFNELSSSHSENEVSDTSSMLNYKTKSRENYKIGKGIQNKFIKNQNYNINSIYYANNENIHNEQNNSVNDNALKINECENDDNLIYNGYRNTYGINNNIQHYKSNSSKSFYNNKNSDNYNEGNISFSKTVGSMNSSQDISSKNYYNILEKISLNMYYYLEGLKYNIYRFQFPECMRGFLFQTASEYLYQKHGAFLIGIITINKEIFLNPIDYIIGEENKYYYTSAFSGIILTTSLDNLIKLSSIKSISKKVSEYNQRRIDERKKRYAKNVVSTDGENGYNKDLELGEKTNKNYENIEKNKNIDKWQNSIISKQNTLTMHRENNKINKLDKSIEQNTNIYKINDKDNSDNNEDQNSKINKNNSNFEMEIISKKNKLILYNFVLGIYEVDNYVSAYRDIFDDKKKPLLLICGWPDNIHMLLKHLKINIYKTMKYKKKNRTIQNGNDKYNNYRSYGDRMKYNIIILSIHVPKFNYENDLLDFSNNTAFIRGSSMDSTNLIKGGIFYAKRIIILNSNHSLFVDKDAYRIDNEVIIIKNIIYQLYNNIFKNKKKYLEIIKKIFKNEYKDKHINEKIIFDTNNNKHDEFQDDSYTSNSDSEIKIVNKQKNKINYNIFNVNKNPYIICLIKNSESLEYIDGSINLSYENYNDNEKMNKIWENCGEYIYTFELVSANIFVDEMLHNLVSFSLPISKYAIEYSVIYSLIGININEYSKNVNMFHKNLKLSTGHVLIIPIPSYFYKKPFYRCFFYLLHKKKYLCIGILRYMNISPLRNISRKLFILSCPSRTMKLEHYDQAYVIAYNTV